MKRLFAVCFVLLCLSSCIKVEQVNLCQNAPPAPAVIKSSVTAAQGAYFSLGILAPDTGLTYYWHSPNGYVYRSANITETGLAQFYGRWGVTAQKMSTCVSDTTFVTVSPVAPSCGMGMDSFLVAGYSPVRYISVPYSNYTDANPYLIEFEDGAGEMLTFYFPSLPKASTVYYLSSYINSLQATQCGLKYDSNSGETYWGNSGNLTVVVTGQVISIEFCNLSLAANSIITNISTSGYLVVN